MPTMPDWKLRLLRWLTNAMLAVIRRWEDRHADPKDYRMGRATTGLWQASQSFKEILNGEYRPPRDMPVGGQDERPEDRGPSDEQVIHMIRNAPLPRLRPQA